MDQLHAMEVFAEVARLGSFSAAGRRLGLTRAMVSKTIMQLEARLDARLLYRSTREVSLTEAGQAYLGPCIATVEQAREAARAISPAGAELAGPLRIQAPSSFGSEWLADAVARFSLRHPLLRASLFVDDALLDPIRHGFDLTIRVGGIPDTGGLALRSLAPCRGVLCASPAYLEQWGMPQTPEALLAHRCLHFSHLTDGTSWHFAKGAQRATVSVNASFTANNGLVLHQAALRGLGIVYSTTFLAWRNLLDGSLVLFSHSYPIAPQPLSLCEAYAEAFAKVWRRLDEVLAKARP